MEQKQKLSNSQLQKRIENAVLHIDKTKENKSIFFSDKGLRLTVDNGYAIVETMYHRHVFSSFTADGVSRPYLYISQFLDIALENIDAITVDMGDKLGKGYSYGKLLEVLKEKYAEKDDDTTFVIANYVDMYLFIIFQNLYSIGETSVNAFLTYLSYVCGIARNFVLFDEHKDGMTTQQFLDEFIKKVIELTDGMADNPMIEPQTDEQLMQENIDAINQQQAEPFLDDVQQG